jgi:hypothetical protein
MADSMKSAVHQLAHKENVQRTNESSKEPINHVTKDQTISEPIHLNACRKHTTSSTVKTTFYTVQGGTPYISLKMAAVFRFITKINRECSRLIAPIYFCLMTETTSFLAPLQKDDKKMKWLLQF